MLLSMVRCMNGAAFILSPCTLRTFPPKFLFETAKQQIQFRLLQNKLTRRNTKSLPNPGALGRAIGGCFMTGGSADGS